MTPPALPWQPLVTIYRGDLPERTVYGLLSVVDGDGVSLLSVGDSETWLWPRSLVKPWQLLSWMPALEKLEPPLEPYHLALMLSSHGASADQLALLDELMDVYDVSPEALQCPACFPMDAERAFALKADGAVAAPRFHPCSGKHLAALLACRVLGHPLDQYLSVSAGITQDFLTEHLPYQSSPLPVAPDGCGMPTWAMPAYQLAGMFCQFAHGDADEPFMQDLQQAMTLFPALVGGPGRLDSRIIGGDMTLPTVGQPVAKEGADGLLGVGLPVSERFPQGLGILLKLAAGYDPTVLTMVITQVFAALGIGLSDIVPASTGTKTVFHFASPGVPTVSS